MTDDTTPVTELVIEQAGEGRPIVVLHGGGGPRTVLPISQHLATRASVLTPTLPGWNAEPRPATLANATAYADALLDHLDRAGLRDVIVIGSSLGGWLTAEMATRDHGKRIAGIVIIDGAGIIVEGEPITDFFSLTPREVAEHSWYDPDRFYVDPAKIPAEQAEIQKANMATMAAVFRDMYNPHLRDRLAGVTIPALVIWGDSDQIFTPGYGRAYADAFANARYELVADAGHLPQLEQPATTLALIDNFLAAFDEPRPE